MDYKAIIEEQIEVLREKQTKDEAGRPHRNDEGYCNIARTIMDLAEVAKHLPVEKEKAELKFGLQNSLTISADKIATEVANRVRESLLKQHKEACQ